MPRHHISRLIIDINESKQRQRAITMCIHVSVNNLNRLIYKCVINLCSYIDCNVANAHLAVRHLNPRIPYAHSVRMHVYQFASRDLVNKGGVLIYKISNHSIH